MTTDLATTEATGAITPVVSADQSPSVALQILNLAISQNADLDRVERLMAIYARTAYDRAMTDFKQNPPTLVKNKVVDFTTKEGKRVNYRHAELDSITSILTPALARHGLTHSWRPVAGRQ